MALAHPEDGTQATKTRSPENRTLVALWLGDFVRGKRGGSALRIGALRGCGHVEDSFGEVFGPCLGFYPSII